MSASGAFNFQSFWRRRARALVRKLGLDVQRYETVLGYDVAPFRTRVRLLVLLNTTMVLDVGANVGQYASALRAAGFDRRIVSFEPLRVPFEQLQQRCLRDTMWECQQLALGVSSGMSTINVANNPAGSSFRSVTSDFGATLPEMQAVSHEVVQVVRLDEIQSSVEELQNGFLKVDVQGYELEVLKGGERLLRSLAGVELELSFDELYAGQPLLPEVVTFMEESGFRLLTLMPGVLDPGTGFPLQVDGFFIRKDHALRLPA